MKKNLLMPKINQSKKLFLISLMLLASFGAFAQLKVNSTGTATIGTGTGSIDATLNLYSSGKPTIYSRASSLPSGGDAIKSEVYSSTANMFAGWTSGTKKFYVKGDGSVWCTLNAYTSDSTLKENFEEIQSAKEKLLKLKGLKYNFKDATDKSRKNIGFLAQDVEKIFPDIVYENDEGIKGIALAELIPVIVEAMKEQQGIIEALEARIEKLEGNSSKEKSATIDDSSIPASLDQNIPNPFSANTTIKMYLPATVSKAVLYIYTMQGEQIQKLTINERGNTSATIDGYALKAGMYLYTLVADGKEVDTKKMILTK